MHLLYLPLIVAVVFTVIGLVGSLAWCVILLTTGGLGALFDDDAWMLLAVLPLFSGGFSFLAALMLCFRDATNQRRAFREARRYLMRLEPTSPEQFAAEHSSVPGQTAKDVQTTLAAVFDVDPSQIPARGDLRSSLNYEVLEMGVITALFHRAAAEHEFEDGVTPFPTAGVETMADLVCQYSALVERGR